MKKINLVVMSAVVISMIIVASMQNSPSLKETANQAPSSVTLNNSTEIINNSVFLSWSQNNDSDFATYTIYQSTANGTLGNAVVEIASTERTWYNETSLLPNTTYFFTVRVCDFFNLCNNSNQINVTTLPGWRSPNISINFQEIQSCVLPLDNSIQHRFTVTNTGSNYETFTLEFYCLETGQTLVGHPQPAIFYLNPGENQSGEISLSTSWGLSGLSGIIGEHDRTLEFRFNDTTTQAPLLSVRKKYPVTVLNSSNVTGNFIIRGTVFDPQGTPRPGCNAKITSGSYDKQITTNDSGQFYFAAPYNRNWAIYPSGFGMSGAPTWNVTPNMNYNLTISPQQGPEYILVKNITTSIGFWRGKASSDGQYIMLLQGMENWNDTSIKNQSQIFLYTINGTLLWNYSMDWESWGGDLSRDARYAVYVTVDHQPETSVLALLNATNGTLLWTKNVTLSNFPSDYGMMASLSTKLSNNNSFIGFGTIGGDFYLLERETGNILWHNWTKGQIREILFNGNDTAVYIGSGDGYLYKFSTNGTLLWKSWIESWPFVEGMKLSQDENFICTVGKSGEITLINTTSGLKIFSYHGGGSAGYCEFSQNGSYLAASVGTGFSYLFDMSGNVLSKWIPIAYCGKFTSNSRYIIAPLNELSIQSIDGITVFSEEVGFPSVTQFVHLASDDRQLVIASRDIPSTGNVSIAFFRLNETEYEDENQTLILPLQQGWNLISFPLDLD